MKHERSLASLALALALAATIGGASLASAQEPPRLEQGGASASAAKQLLHGRNRAVLHMGQSVELVGLSESDARARTPALAQGESTVTKVETQNYYERTLAMYQDRKLFDRPPVSEAGSEAPGREKPVTAPAKTPPPPATSTGHWMWFICLLAMPLIALVLVHLRGGFPWKKAAGAPQHAGSPSKARVRARTA